MTCPRSEISADIDAAKAKVAQLEGKLESALGAEDYDTADVCQSNLDAENVRRAWHCVCNCMLRL